MTDALVALGLVALIVFGFNEYQHERKAQSACSAAGASREVTTKLLNRSCYVEVAPYVWLELKAYDERVSHDPMRVRP